MFNNATIITSPDMTKYPVGSIVPSIGILYLLKTTIELFDTKGDIFSGYKMELDLKPTI